MNIEIQNERVIIGKESLAYYGYYFDIEAKEKGSSRLLVMKRVSRSGQWH